ncbi:hypothetical protein BDW69DRAFT_33717 [Aspergillus filifer]
MLLIIRMLLTFCGVAWPLTFIYLIAAVGASIKYGEYCNYHAAQKLGRVSTEKMLLMQLSPVKKSTSVQVRAISRRREPEKDYY